MKKKVKKALIQAIKEEFEAPNPVKKRSFLAAVQEPSISNLDFMFSQITYIRKWIWAFSVIVFCIALASAKYMEKDMIWIISAFVPLLALSVISESGRSDVHGMAEFEMCTRFSLKSVVLARLGILGAANLILVCFFIPLAMSNKQFSVLQTSLYMVCPYLLTSICGLWVMRKVRGRESVYLCCGIAVGIGVGSVVFFQMFPWIYETSRIFWWIAGLIVLCAGAARQCGLMIRQTEELAS